MRPLLSAGFAVFAAFAATPASATPFHLQTFTGVQIGATRYNVSFTDTAFNNLALELQNPTFVTVADATAALNAIISYAGTPSYNSLIAQASIPGNPYRSVIVPITAAFARNPDVGDFTSVYRGVGIDDVPAAADGYQLEAGVNYNFNVPFDVNASVFPGGLTIATFVASASAEVPEPASIAVLALGLFGAGLARRRPG